MADGSRNPYAVLGVSHGATDEEIRRAYRRLVVETHRTKVLDIVDQLDALKQAYETLGDPERRRALDAKPLPSPWAPPAGPSDGLVELHRRATRDVQRLSLRIGERATARNAATMAEIETDYDRREAAVQKTLRKRRLVRDGLRALAATAIIAAALGAKRWLGL